MLQLDWHDWATKKLSSPYDLVGINNSVIMYVTIQRDVYKEDKYWNRLFYDDMEGLRMTSNFCSFISSWKNDLETCCNHGSL